MCLQFCEKKRQRSDSNVLGWYMSILHGKIYISVNIYTLYSLCCLFILWFWQISNSYLAKLWSMYAHIEKHVRLLIQYTPRYYMLCSILLFFFLFIVICDACLHLNCQRYTATAVFLFFMNHILFYSYSIPISNIVCSVFSASFLPIATFIRFLSKLSFTAKFNVLCLQSQMNAYHLDFRLVYSCSVDTTKRRYIIICIQQFSLGLSFILSCVLCYGIGFILFAI